jgi:hypothetical protein
VGPVAGLHNMETGIKRSKSGQNFGSFLWSSSSPAAYMALIVVIVVKVPKVVKVVKVAKK